MMSRRNLITSSAAALGTGALALSTPAQAKRTSVFGDTVLTAFRKHRLVALGEYHGLQEHHDALATLLLHPRFPDTVNDVVVEFGNARYQPLIDRFVAGETVENADLVRVWRDTTQSPLGTWDAPVYEHFFRTIRAVNQILPRDRRVRVLLGDPPLDWATITTREQLSTYLLQRGEHASSVIQREVLAKGRRALVCYGTSHVLRTSALFKALPERTYAIATLTPLAGDPGGIFARLDGQPRRTVIPTASTWLGDFDAGKVFPAPRRGPSGEPANAMCGVPLHDVIDAAVYLGQTGDLTLSRENPALYLDPVYWAELLRRHTIQGSPGNIDRLRQTQPVTFSPQVLPPPFQCP